MQIVQHIVSNVHIAPSLSRRIVGGMILAMLEKKSKTNFVCDQAWDSFQGWAIVLLLHDQVLLVSELESIFVMTSGNNFQG